MELSYQINTKHKLKFATGLFLSLVMLCFGSFSATIGLYFISVILLVFAFTIIYLFVVVFPIEITISDQRIIYKTLIRKRNIDFSEISDVKTFYLTRSLTIAGGDKQKADMYCLIKLKRKSLNLFLFSNGIKNYKDIYFQIYDSLKSYDRK